VYVWYKNVILALYLTLKHCHIVHKSSVFLCEREWISSKVLCGQAPRSFYTCHTQIHTHFNSEIEVLLYIAIVEFG